MTAPAATDEPAGGIGQTASGGALGSIFELAAVRAAVHDGGARWRVVWELDAATGMPLYEIVERRLPAVPPVPALAGAAFLEVTLHDVYLRELTTTLPLEHPPGAAVTGVTLIPLEDDASVRFGVGLAEPARFAVFEEREPARLVVDIYTP
jgi:hypothetical protein